MRFCENCGKQIKDEAVFCPYCGTMVDSGNTDVNVTVSDGQSVSVSDELPGVSASKDGAPEPPKNRKASGKLGGVLGFVICILLVLLFFWIYGIIKGADDGGEPVKYAPNQLPQEQVR